MPTETDKTLTQLATELGVSRDKVIYRYKKLPKDAYYKENNTIYIKEAGVQQIIDELGDDLNELSHPEEEVTEQDVLSIHNYLIEQLTKKDEQIERLQKLIDQQQQLNAEDKKLIKELHQHFALEAPKETTEIKSANEEEPSEEEIKQSEELAQQIAQLEEQIRKSEALNQEKERLEQELASLKNKKWYQFWK